MFLSVVDMFLNLITLNLVHQKRIDNLEQESKKEKKICRLAIFF